jgi:hypothetical protein
VIGIDYAGELRREICARNSEFASLKRLTHVPSYGAVPVTVYAPEADGKRHGNFYPASYRAILREENWSARLNKVHSQARTALPRADRRWRELDSCTSSDALLMNIFCCPGVCSSTTVALMSGTETTDEPIFGFRARVPLKVRPTGTSPVDRTEVDMKLGPLLVEAKLTENDFQIAPSKLVENYRDVEQVFDMKALPRSGNHYISYQLIRNVLAAHADDLSFCVMLDARRPDLVEAWYAIMSCVRDSQLRTRCKVLTWQELSVALPPGLRRFLHEKYGIEAR